MSETVASPLIVPSGSTASGRGGGRGRVFALLLRAKPKR